MDHGPCRSHIPVRVSHGARRHNISILDIEEIEGTMSDSSSDEEEHSHNELDAWRQLHENLTNAVIIAKEAVAAKKLQRRFWLEEICANLTEEGKLTANSVWKRPVPVKKTVVKRAPKPKEPVVKKRKPKAEPKPKKPRKKKSIGDDDEEGQPKKKKIRLKLDKEAQEAEPVEIVADNDQHSQDASETVDDEDEEDEESETETEYPHETGASSLLRAADYASTPQWGSTSHGYMVSEGKRWLCVKCKA
jgi:outer membrane biosynthesis protein TonB